MGEFDEVAGNKIHTQKSVAFASQTMPLLRINLQVQSHSC